MANTFPSNNLDSKLIKSSKHNILKTIRDLQESEKKLYEILSTQSAETPNINLQPIITWQDQRNQVVSYLSLR